VGDRGALAAEEKCSCGRTLPLLAAIEGRRDDVLYTRDGRKIGRLDPVFKAHLPIREAQVVQESLTEIRVCFVPTEGYTPTAGETLAEELRRRLGPVRVILDRVSEIPRAAGGKFRAVVCNLSAAERRALDRR
jgi:phenylacetate-CoA ligase